MDDSVLGRREDLRVAVCKLPVSYRLIGIGPLLVDLVSSLQNSAIQLVGFFCFSLAVSKSFATDLTFDRVPAFALNFQAP